MHRALLRASLLGGAAAVLVGLAAWAARTPAPHGRPPPAPPSTRPAPAVVPPARPAAPLSSPGRWPEALARAVADAAGFAPLPTPGPSDWLSVHEEPGQTLAEFEASDREVPEPGRRTIRLRPLDDLSRAGVPVALVAEHLEAFVGLPVVVDAAATPPPFTTRRAAWGSEQTRAPDVLRWLRRTIPDDAYGLVALTTRDLYPEESWHFVFGLASLRSRVGVFSFARMSPEFPEAPPAARPPYQRALVVLRCLRIVSHETGHLFGIEHCVHHACLMNGGNHVAEMDRTPEHLCPVCLQKLFRAAPFDPAARYRRLEALYRREGLLPEADWNAARAAHVERAAATDDRR